MRLRDEFLSIASHELKTPLTPLSLKLQALRRELDRTPGPVPARAAWSTTWTWARGRLQKLAELVNDLLDVSRIAAGRLPLELRGGGPGGAGARGGGRATRAPQARSGSALQLERADAGARACGTGCGWSRW